MRDPGQSSNETERRPESEQDGVVIRPGLQFLLDDFSLTFGVHIRLYSPADHCILQSPIGCKTLLCGRLPDTGQCRAQGRRMRHMAADRRGPFLYTCHAGLRYCLYPLSAGNRLIAIAEIGNFRYGKSLSATVIHEWLQRLDGTESLQREFEKLPRFSESEEERLVRMFTLVAEHAVGKRLIALRLNPLFEKIVNYVRECITLPHIPIEDVAEHVKRSPSTVSHVVKKEAGITFSQLVIEEKLKAAESMLVANPVKPIGELADELGYSDQFYFSRLFKKYRGVAPSEWARSYVR